MFKLYKSLLFLFCLSIFTISCEKEQKAELDLSTYQLSIPNINGTAVIDVSCNGKWTASLSSNSWCTISPTSGSGNGQIVVTATDNFDIETRSVSFIVTSRDLKKNVRVTQSYSSLDLDKSNVTVKKEGESVTVNINSNTHWSVEIPDGKTWITSSTLSGTGNGQVIFNISNNEGQERSADVTFRYGTQGRVLQITQQRSINLPPDAPILSSPANNLSDANRLPTFRWKESKDPDGDKVTYRLEFGKDQTNFQNSISIQDTVHNLSAYLDPNSSYYWRVIAKDSFGEETSSPIYTFTTGIKTSYFDAEFKIAQTNSKGINPSEILFIGDGYISEDYEEGGLFDKDMDAGIEHFFAVEPYKSYRDYFKVYKQAAYSRERGATQTDKGIKKNTKFEVDFQGGSSMAANTETVFNYALSIQGITEEKLKSLLIVLVVNQDRYAGTCWMWSDGKAIAITPVSKSTNPGSNYSNLINHEAGGHGYGKLADEYVTSANSGKRIDTETKNQYLNFAKYGYYSNVDTTGNTSIIKWKHFIGKSGYERVGAYEGAYYFSLGMWRPELTSCMIFNEPYYNAPSREAIVKRIMQTAGEEFTMEKFVEKDIQKAPGNAAVIQTKSMNPLTFVPLAPPVIVK